MVAFRVGSANPAAGRGYNLHLQVQFDCSQYRKPEYKLQNHFLD